MTRGDGPPPLIVHVIYRLAVGGLENGLVNLINRMPAGRYRHAIVSLTDISDFRQRLERPDVDCFALHKRPGHDLRMLWRLWRLFLALRPMIVHSRNLAAMDAQLPAWLAGVPVRIHGEHGRDVHDLDGNSRKYRWLRRGFRPLIHRYVPLSRDLEAYLRGPVGVPESRIRLICNGVDTQRFRPGAIRAGVLPSGFAGEDSLVIGTVGRLETVKDQLTLVKAFVELVRSLPEGERLRLVLVGEGSLRAAIEALLAETGLARQVWLAGARDDVPALMAALDLFVLPSLAEGISNTVLEAMACGLPVVATRVGGNAELVEEGKTGFLVERDDPTAMAAALAGYVHDSVLRQDHGAAARQRIEEQFSLDGMVARYTDLYDELCRHPTDEGA
ncbi:MAG: TIGR03088 family PEP-CTERM/XrtA system glycosyltransferase [Gammaproteobacteria bacterium]|nr:TIGR03088 family PEP-CTERM/XrtA system glycosyltransferase [Gammaproteobacteria bacterium]